MSEFDINDRATLFLEKISTLSYADQLCKLILNCCTLRSKFNFEKEEILQLREYYASLDFDVLVVIFFSIQNLEYQLGKIHSGESPVEKSAVVVDSSSFESFTNPPGGTEVFSPYEVNLDGLPLDFDCNPKTSNQFIEWIVESLISDLGIYNLAQIIKDPSKNRHLNNDIIDFLSKRFQEHNINQVLDEVKRELFKLPTKSLIYLYISLAEKVSPFLDRDNKEKHITLRVNQLKHILGLAEEGIENNMGDIVM